ncbi:HD domain-containing protein, partial [Thermodesulfobacteriota bacterium]
RVAIEMKRYFKQDFKRIGHASRVARYAEKIGIDEGGNLAVILTASYLHDIGIKEAERKNEDTSVRHHEEEGPPIAKEILNRLGADKELIEEVCDIIGHHHRSGPEETNDFKVVYDADLITNIEEKQKETPVDSEELAEIIEQSFLTETGRVLAESILFKGGKDDS